MGRSKGAAMENNCAIDQTELENLSYEFSDEALEIAAAGGEKVAGNITLYHYYCTALYLSRPLTDSVRAARWVGYELNDPLNPTPRRSTFVVSERNFLASG